jgi:LytS/YehU family sensor histidine kinase
MNPHFIFNSLNSIENFMMQNEKRLASSYLNKFARLIRMILDSSRNELVPLSRDMEALHLYVDLEQLRFNHKFCFNFMLIPPSSMEITKCPLCLFSLMSKTQLYMARTQ